MAPVLVGTAAAHLDGPTLWWRALAALAVALALQVGVNYANDYSDGVRGTDEHRAGPLRLTASGFASPRAVKTAAILAFAVAAVVGGVLALVVNPWLLLVGAAAIAAGALYTGGPKPYGYLGLGEVMVLVFFGVVATSGSAYVQVEHVPSSAWWGSLTVGLLACAILLANNVRDVTTDERAGKRTLAVRLGATTSRRLFAACVALAFVAVVPIAIAHPWAWLAFVALVLAIGPVHTMLTQTAAPRLLDALGATARLELVTAVLVATGLWLSA